MHMAIVGSNLDLNLAKRQLGGQLGTGSLETGFVEGEGRSFVRVITAMPYLLGLF
jgi:hypothetical protein